MSPGGCRTSNPEKPRLVCLGNSLGAGCRTKNAKYSPHVESDSIFGNSLSGGNLLVAHYLAIVSKNASATPLTAQHLRIVAMLGQGLSDKKIAGAEGISEDTVAFHVRTIFRVLGATTRAQAVAKAYQAGFFRIRRPGAPGTHP